MSDEGTTNFDMRTDLNYEVIDISARSNVVEGRSKWMKNQTKRVDQPAPLAQVLHFL